MCKTTKHNAGSGSDMTHLESVENLHPSISLGDHLRKLSGVSIVGSAQNIQVVLTGYKTYNGYPEPLFVVDRNIIPGGYLAAEGVVDVNDIQSIRVVRDINERTQYGFRDANGVNDFKTKK